MFSGSPGNPSVIARLGEGRFPASPLDLALAEVLRDHGGPAVEAEGRVGGYAARLWQYQGGTARAVASTLELTPRPGVLRHGAEELAEAGEGLDLHGVGVADGLLAELLPARIDLGGGGDKTVKGNRYRYAIVWNRKTGKQDYIYLGPVEPKRLRGILTEKDVRSLHTLIRFYDDGRHPAYAEALSKVLEAYEAGE